MPIFRRPDGELIPDQSPVRMVMPYIMRGRNESAVYHEDNYDITKTRAWLRAYNEARPDENPVGLFHLITWATGRGLHQRPGMNRFVMGGDFYQRKGVFVTFAAKRQMADDAPLIAIKQEFQPDTTFADAVARINRSVTGGRAGEESQVDKELALLTKIPRILRSPIMRIVHWLDRVNLLPGFMIENDPLYTSLFIANLGSIGLDRSFHHLYEVGTCSLFLCIGTMKRETTTNRHGKPETRDTVQLRWTLDERVADGFYAGASLRWFKKVIEDPEKHIGPPGLATETAAAETDQEREATPDASDARARLPPPDSRADTATSTR